MEVNPEGVRASNGPGVKVVGVSEGEAMLFIEVLSEAGYGRGFWV